MIYIFIGRQYDKGIPARCVNEFFKICTSEEGVYLNALAHPRGFRVYLIDREMDPETILEQAEAWKRNAETDRELAEYQRLKSKFEGK